MHFCTKSKVKKKCCSRTGLYTSGVYEEKVWRYENTNLLGDFVTGAVHIYQDLGTFSTRTQMRILKFHFKKKDQRFVI